MIELERTGLGEFAAQLELENGADRWYRLIVPESTDQAMVAEQLALEIDGVLGSTCQRIDASAGPAQLVRMVRDAGNSPVAIYGVDAYSDADWQHVDLLRSQLVGGGPKICWRGCRARKMENPLHLTSFLVGRPGG